MADTVIKPVFLTFYCPHTERKWHRLSPQDTQWIRVGSVNSARYQTSRGGWSHVLPFPNSLCKPRTERRGGWNEQCCKERFPTFVCLNLSGAQHRENTPTCNDRKGKDLKKWETQLTLVKSSCTLALPAGEHLWRRASCLLEPGSWPTGWLSQAALLPPSSWSLGLQSRLYWRRSFLTLGPHFPACIHRISSQLLYSWAQNS